MGIRQYYNKLIDVELIDTAAKTSTFIRCPKTGRKPQIEISGTLMPMDLVNSFEVRITNFYPDDVSKNYQAVRVYAGYENDKSAVFEGSIVAMYTESPGPDRVTVIFCNTASMGSWSDITVQLSLDPGFTVAQAVTKIAQALNFNVQLGKDAETKTSEIRWDYNGSARQALTELEKYFPNTQIVINNNRITVDMPGTVRKTYRLPYLNTPAQFTASGCTLMAPWDPNIKPMDLVTFPMGTYKTAQAAVVNSTIQVQTIAFNFDTAGGTNTMTITGGSNL